MALKLVKYLQVQELLNFSEKACSKKNKVQQYQKSFIQLFLTNTGISAAPGFGNGDDWEENLKLGVQQSHIFSAENLKK